MPKDDRAVRNIAETDRSERMVTEGSPDAFEGSAFYDDDGKIYYYNNSSGQSTWEAPDKFNPPPEPESEKDAIGGVGLEISETGEDREEKVSTKAGPWVAYQDEEGREYYFNTLTQETTWDKPANLESLKPEEAEQRATNSSPTLDGVALHMESEVQESQNMHTEKETSALLDHDIRRTQNAEEGLNQPDALMEPGELIMQFPDLHLFTSNNPILLCNQM